MKKIKEFFKELRKEMGNANTTEYFIKEIM